jgi:rhodanese-related sulfurtransferase
VSNSTLVSPEDAFCLLQRGYTYVDVRSEPEFAQGHVPTAINVPLQRVEGDRLVDNPEFLSVMRAAFRTTDPLVVGCRSGSRSRVAVERLQASGFTQVLELRHGFLGARDDFGRSLKGWVAFGLPIATEASDLSQYQALVARCLGTASVRKR